MLVIFSDLDGTLLDPETYRFAAAEPALRLLRNRRIPLVPVSGKTRSEVEHIRTQMQIGGPFVVENGAATWLPLLRLTGRQREASPNDAGEFIQFASPYPEVADSLRKAATEARTRVIQFADLNPTEVAKLTGLSLDEAQRARRRVHDEPFLLCDESRAPQLQAALERRGRRCSRGGKFYHATDPLNKGDAVRWLRDHFLAEEPDTQFMGLGDSPNDIPFLEACDIQVIVKSGHKEEMKRALPSAIVTEQPGPQGWNDAVLSHL